MSLDMRMIFSGLRAYKGDSGPFPLFLGVEVHRPTLACRWNKTGMLIELAGELRAVDAPGAKTV